jgi:hypothetical protein
MTPNHLRVLQICALASCPACGALEGVPCHSECGRPWKSGTHAVRRDRARSARRERRKVAPKVVCLCGSTRFYTTFQEANYRETMSGHIVLSVGFYPHAQNEMHGEERGCTPHEKAALDELHKRKIDLADEVLVLDVGGYIGSSTRGEIQYAELWGKPVRYLSQEGGAA